MKTRKEFENHVMLLGCRPTRWQQTNTIVCPDALQHGHHSIRPEWGVGSLSMGLTKANIWSGTPDRNYNSVQSTSAGPSDGQYFTGCRNAPHNKRTTTPKKKNALPMASGGT